MSLRYGSSWGRVLSSVLVVVAASGEGLSAGEPEARLVEEVARLRGSVERVALLVETGMRHQRLGLLLRRIQLEEARIEPLESRVRRAESELQGREEEMARMQRLLEDQDQEIRESLRTGTEPPEDTRRLADEIRRQLEILEVETSNWRLRLRTAEDDLAVRRKRIAILDEQLDERFDEAFE